MREILIAFGLGVVAPAATVAAFVSAMVKGLDIFPIVTSMGSNWLVSKPEFRNLPLGEALLTPLRAFIGTRFFSVRRSIIVFGFTLTMYVLVVVRAYFFSSTKEDLIRLSLNVIGTWAYPVFIGDPLLFMEPLALTISFGYLSLALLERCTRFKAEKVKMRSVLLALGAASAQLIIVACLLLPLFVYLFDFTGDGLELATKIIRRFLVNETLIVNDDDADESFSALSLVVTLACFILALSPYILVLFSSCMVLLSLLFVKGLETYTRLIDPWMSRVHEEIVIKKPMTLLAPYCAGFAFAIVASLCILWVSFYEPMLHTAQTFARRTRFLAFT